MRSSSLMPAIAAAMVLASLDPGAARAETSSWVGRDDGPAEPAPASKKKADPKAAPAPKIIKTVPGTPTVLPSLAPPVAPSSQASPVAPAAPKAMANPAPEAKPASPGSAASEYAKTPAPGE